MCEYSVVCVCVCLRVYVSNLLYGYMDIFFSVFYYLSRMSRLATTNTQCAGQYLQNQKGISLRWAYAQLPDSLYEMSFKTPRLLNLCVPRTTRSQQIVCCCCCAARIEYCRTRFSARHVAHQTRAARAFCDTSSRSLCTRAQSTRTLPNRGAFSPNNRYVI